MKPLPLEGDLPEMFIGSFKDLHDATSPMAQLYAVEMRVIQLRSQIIFQAWATHLLAHPNGNWKIQFDYNENDNEHHPKVHYGTNVSHQGEDPAQVFVEWMHDPMDHGIVCELDFMTTQVYEVKDGQCPQLEETARKLWGEAYLAAWQRERLTQNLAEPADAPRGPRL